MARRDAVRAGLKTIVAEYEARGVDLTADSRRTEAILLDSFPEDPAEIHALVEAIRSGALQYLRDRAPQGRVFSIQGAATQLAEGAGLREDLAQWAVESWWQALALGGPEPAAPETPEEVAATNGDEPAAVATPIAGAAPATVPPAQPMSRRPLQQPLVPPPEPEEPRAPEGAGLGAAAGLAGAAGVAAAEGQAGLEAPAPHDPVMEGGAAAGTAPPHAPEAAGTEGGSAPPYAPGESRPTGSTAPPYPPGQSGTAGSTAPPYAPGESGPPGSTAPPQPPSQQWPTSGGTMPPQPPPPASKGRSSRTPLIVVGVVVLVAVAYIGIAAAAKIPPFKSSAATTSTTTGPPTPAKTLAGKVPNSGACLTLTGSTLQSDFPSAAAGLKCFPESGLTVFYGIFKDKATVANEYNATISKFAGSLPSGFCKEQNEVQGTYTVSGQTAGSLACYETSAAQVVLWWHYSDNILSSAVSSSLTHAQIMSEWNSDLGPS